MSRVTCEMSVLKTVLMIMILWIIGLCGPCLSVQLLTHLSSNMDGRGGDASWLTCSYSREALLALQPELTRETTSSHLYRSVLDNIPQELIRTNRRKKRGRRGGIRNRLRRRFNRPPLPSIVLTNLRSEQQSGRDKDIHKAL